MPSLKDVAKRAGVSPTTVSRVLNNRGYISEETRRKVYKAMEELNYQPNEIARALFKKRSYFLGLIIPDISHPFFAEITKYIEYYAYLKGYKVLICNSYLDGHKEKEYIKMLKRHQVDGIIMGSHTLNVEDYKSINLPIVALDRYISEDIPCITSDNFTGAIMATKLLIERGCKYLAHISGPLELNTPANDRYYGFLKVVREKGIKHVVVETKLNKFEIEEYQKIIKDLFEKHPQIDGIFASSDLIAATVIRMADRFKKNVPKDLKVVGFDDIGLASLLRPSLTTIRQDKDKMAQKLIEVLIDKIEGKNAESKYILPISLIERESTKIK
ncbi:LacI family DNA-binding transcriptional regulator [Dictyoglomus thermophilum]|uniref:Transcriptional regulator n=1 Tax=Dictyoglomus thermophilum (strain ATCC 35947 / DSM 3960 / H-6-12) TaxID=309799 RepID=B5YAX3_DICT6|nr:LacI family DNA-binding transcriptional regulator [Dictyoglomus thermophilum]ACI18415.1 transcriptional regulator [Dictyoglomus thermophilum H-6-12]